MVIISQSASIHEIAYTLHKQHLLAIPHYMLALMPCSSPAHLMLLLQQSVPFCLYRCKLLSQTARFSTAMCQLLRQQHSLSPHLFYLTAVGVAPNLGLLAHVLNFLHAKPDAQITAVEVPAQLICSGLQDNTAYLAMLYASPPFLLLVTWLSVTLLLASTTTSRPWCCLS